MYHARGRFSEKLRFAIAGMSTGVMPMMVAVLGAPSLCAQTQPPLSKFEVASLKRHASQEPTRIGLRAAGDTVTGTVSVRQLILTAYGLQPFQLAGGPNWMDDRYDLAAKVEAGGSITMEQAAPLLRTLLADRLQFRAHTEMRDIPVYELVVARNGIKIRESAADATSQTALPSGKSSAMQLHTGKATMERLAKMLTGYAGRPVMDQTGLTAGYRIDLEWASDSVAPDSFADAPSLVTAVQDQLGLRLQPAKRSMEVLVIDNAARPSEN